MYNLRLYRDVLSKIDIITIIVVLLANLMTVLLRMRWYCGSEGRFGLISKGGIPRGENAWLHFKFRWSGQLPLLLRYVGWCLRRHLARQFWHKNERALAFSQALHSFPCLFSSQSENNSKNTNFYYPAEILLLEQLWGNCNLFSSARCFCCSCRCLRLCRHAMPLPRPRCRLLQGPPYRSSVDRVVLLAIKTKS